MERDSTKKRGDAGYTYIHAEERVNAWAALGRRCTSLGWFSNSSMSSSNSIVEVFMSCFLLRYIIALYPRLQNIIFGLFDSRKQKQKSSFSKLEHMLFHVNKGRGELLLFLDNLKLQSYFAVIKSQESQRWRNRGKD